MKTMMTAMSTLTIELDNALASELEASAKRESKPVPVWAAERLRMAAAMEATAAANGYPVGWLNLFGSISEDERFKAPERRSTPDVNGFEME
jgi:hypothetical protein